MRRLRGPAALLILCACQRDLALPKEPSAETPRPRLLGDRAGTYQAFTEVAVDGEAPQWLPAGPRMPVLHVENPTDEPYDLLLAQLRPLELPRPQPPPAGMVVETCQRELVHEGIAYAAGAYDPVSGAVSLGTGEPSAAGESVQVEGRSLAAGGFQLDVPFCGKNGEHALVLQPICPLQRSISGVYGGARGSTPGVTTDLAIGVSGSKLLFVEWPPGGLAALTTAGAFGVGRFDPLSESGAFLGERTSPAGASSSCGIVQFGRLGREVEVGTGEWTLGAARPCPLLVDPAPAQLPALDDSFTGSRLLGEPDAACGEVTGLSLVSTAVVRTCGGRRVLDVLTHFEDDPTALVADEPFVTGAPAPTAEEIVADGLWVRTVAAADGVQLRRMAAPQAWPPVTARFELPARAGHVFLQTHAAQLFTGASGSSLPLCPAVEAR